MSRECDGCTSCCTGVITFTDVDANDNIIVSTREHGCTKYAKGCTIYNDRPKTCKEFDCLYIQDEGLPEIMKPSNCGFIMHGYNATDTENSRIVLSQNTDGPDIDERALLWGLWWALTETKHDVELNTHKMGSMRYR